jgi:glycosyltransferase involved in cell wall biosynthesis
MDTVINLEVSPLREHSYTGISQVTAALADQMLGDTTRRTAFFFGRAMIGHDIVEDLVARRDGGMVEWYMQRAGTQPAPLDAACFNVAIFPNRKASRRGFNFECQIVHDLSTLLTPQFHNRDTINYHAMTLLNDVQTNDLTFCVSEATRQDVLRYLGPLDPERVVTTPLGATIDAGVDLDTEGRIAEPYILVLGTIEPRKNVTMILEYIARRPEVLGRTRFLFLGRFGWGAPFNDLLAAYGLTQAFEAGKLVFPGFVSEPVKNTLISHARLIIYPSLFEGFGLPVLEGLAHGVPALITRSSSLPEVGGDCCYYFDPFTPGDFDTALSRAIADVQRRAPAVRAACLAQAARFSWANTYAAMMRAVEARLPAAAR